MNEGKKDRRDPIRTIKAKNPVAKNASKAIGGGAAGAHKDKKKAAKQGDVKHKKAEYAESLQNKLDAVLAEGFFGDIKQSFATGMVDKLKKAIPAQYHKHYDFDSVKSPGDTKAIVARARAAGHLKEQGMAEGNIPPDGTPEYDQFINRGGKTPFDLGGADAYYGRQHDITAEYGFQKGSPEWDEYINGYRDTYQNSDMRKDYGGGRASAVQPRRITKTPEAMNGITGPGMMRDPAMEDEGDKEGLPHLTKKLAQHIADQIDSEGAHAIVKSVQWGDGAAKELTQFIQRALRKAVSGMKEDTHQQRSAEADKKFAEREAARKKNPGAASGDRIKELEKRYPAKEGWTHDSLADQLFEHERTYEDKLANMLKKKTQK